MSGVIEIKLGGKTVTLRFNLWQKDALGSLYGTDPLDALSKIQARAKDSVLLVICDLIYTGMIGNYRVQHKDIDFTIDQIIEWVGEAENVDIAAVYPAWLDSIGIRNLLPGEEASKKKQPSQKPATKKNHLGRNKGLRTGGNGVTA